MRDILIVEDGLHERQRLGKLFSAARFSVSCAESVGEAERLLDLEVFRLAVIDIGLGDRSGSVLFERMKRSPTAPLVIILTGNPSIHLKQRFLDEGAAAYIVKASPAASNDALLSLVQSLIGAGGSFSVTGIPLEDFLRQYVSEQSRELFLDAAMEVPPCKHCGSRNYIVSFSHKTQLPPTVEGRVICADCERDMDPEVG